MNLSRTILGTAALLLIPQSGARAGTQGLASSSPRRQDLEDGLA